MPVPWTQLVGVSACGAEGARVRIEGYTEGAGGAAFCMTFDGREWGAVRWALSGFFNVRNAAMAATAAALALHPDDPRRLDISVLGRFRGVKRRQETLVERAGLAVVEDFGHHPTAIRETIRGLRGRYPDSTITAAFEPRSNTARTKVLQPGFQDALGTADRVVLGAVDRPEKLSVDRRFDTAAVAAELRRRGLPAVACADNHEVFSVLMEMARVPGPNTGLQVIVFFSNGSFGGVIARFAAAMRTAEVTASR
jgi:UDP-N-acetylmuramate: L-alanyl-gamma-D-glutamyl-meso-diaminopimelate ligase